MSAAVPEGSTVSKERKGLSKVLSRMRTVLGRGRDSSRRLSQAHGVQASTAEPQVAASTSRAVAQPPGPDEPASASPTVAREREKKVPEQQRIPKAQIYEERAQRLAERFGLNITKQEWHAPDGDALRVEKPIRMRVRRYCHVCNQAFGVERNCINCKHERCRDCIRYPPKLNEAEREDLRKRRAALSSRLKADAPIVPDYDAKPEEIPLRRQVRGGGPDQVYRKPRQRVRRNCHECGTLFSAGSRKCENCGHVRCTDCPRDPSKKDRYPYGYPGDEYGPHAVPHYKCHECSTTFPPDPSEGKECSHCGHARCNACRRLLPKKVQPPEPEPDPELWARVQERLRNLDLSA